MKKCMVMFFLVVQLIGLSCYATNLEDNNTLTLSIKNDTLATLNFDRVFSKNPSNQITMSATILKPGDTLTIKITKSSRNDIYARINFKDEHGASILLYLLDQIQLHIGQPVFNMSTGRYYSVLLSKTRNKNHGPLDLTFLQAELRLLNN